jgi:hypothetical protein
VRGKVSLRVQQLDVLCDTKTKDNVFVQLQVPSLHGLLWAVVVWHVMSCRVRCAAAQFGESRARGVRFANSWCCHAQVSVQYQVVKEAVYDAFYKLTDSRTQITSYGEMQVLGSLHWKLYPCYCWG